MLLVIQDGEWVEGGGFVLSLCWESFCIFSLLFNPLGFTLQVFAKDQVG